MPPAQKQKMNVLNVSGIMKALLGKHKKWLFIFTENKEFVRDLVSQNKPIQMQHSSVCMADHDV